MSNFNKTFRTSIPSQPPYYYVSAELDLAGISNGETLYFNLDNSFDYTTNRDYYRYIQITNQSIIGDVIVSTDPVVTTLSETANGPLFTIGGAPSIYSDVDVPYAAPAGFGPKIPPQFSGSSLRTNELNANPVNYFGHTAAGFPYGQDNSGNPDTNKNFKFLAITIRNPDLSLGVPIVESGVVKVIIKVYPK